jgi:hypothetical protein
MTIVILITGFSLNKVAGMNGAAEDWIRVKKNSVIPCDPVGWSHPKTQSAENNGRSEDKGEDENTNKGSGCPHQLGVAGLCALNDYKRRKVPAC